MLLHDMITFILGGARSGKSRYAETLAAKHPGRKTYIATAEALDDEMRARIAQHRAQRGNGWDTIEAPLDLVGALESSAGLVLIDCITLWISNLMHHGRDVQAEVGKFCAALKSKAKVVIVSNEVGLGIVPDNQLARAFRDEQGRANQRLAEIADDVIFVAAGLPLVLKKSQPKPARAKTARSSPADKA